MWNKAADYAINQFLVDEGFVLPEGGLLDSKYRNMTAESIYSILEAEKEQEQQQQQQNEQGQGEQGKQGNEQGDGNDQTQGEIKAEEWGEFSMPTDVENAEEESNQKQKMVQASTMAQQGEGKMNAELLRQINELIEPKINWQETLQRFISEIAHNDYNFMKPNRRYMSHGLCMPSLENQEVGNVIFVIDTSGSINLDMLNRFESELKDAMEMFEFPVTVIHADNKVQKVEELDIDERIKPVGGGGTNFIPAFELIEEEYSDAKAIVYFTDGACYRIPNDCEIPTIWAQYKDFPFKPNFGEVIKVD